MINSWKGKTSKKVVGVIMLLWTLPFLFDSFLFGMIVAGISVYAIVGLDMRRTVKASKIIFKRFYETLNHTLEYGIIPKKTERKNLEKEQPQQENEIILNNISLIMDKDLNELDIANNYFLQNLKNYQEAVYEIWTDRLIKLNSLNTNEEEQLKNYFFISSFRGHRMAIAVLKENTNSISQMETKIIPSEIAYQILQNVNLPEHPAIKNIGHSQYKFYSDLNINVLTEAEILDMTEEFIQVGYKNTMANFLALKELTETTNKPA